MWQVIPLPRADPTLSTRRRTGKEVALEKACGEGADDGPRLCLRFRIGRRRPQPCAGTTRRSVAASRWLLPKPSRARDVRDQTRPAFRLRGLSARELIDARVQRANWLIGLRGEDPAAATRTPLPSTRRGDQGSRPGDRAAGCTLRQAGRHRDLEETLRSPSARRVRRLQPSRVRRAGGRAAAARQRSRIVQEQLTTKGNTAVRAPSISWWPQPRKKQASLCSTSTATSKPLLARRGSRSA